MSAFLGPIHHWLYNKIQLQEEMTQTILGSLSAETLEPLLVALQERFNELPEGALEDHIDVTQIHGWLQDKVTLVEKRYAFVVSYVLDHELKTMEELTNLIHQLGKQKGKQKGKQTKIATVKQAYQLLNDMLLDGMPCDHINRVVEESDREIRFFRTQCIHAQHWDEYNQEVSVYYTLREAFIKGLLVYSPVGYSVNEEGDQCLFLNSVSIMMEEHQHILRMVEVVREACFGIMNGSEIPYEDFTDIIDFIRTYADNHHHGKEEKIMFQEMQNHLGKMGENLIRHGMLVEHDLGRLHVKELEEALALVKAGDEKSKLDVIANAISYTHLIKRHIQKEDELIYVYGEKNLPLEVMGDVNQRTYEFEEEARQQGVQEKYLALLQRLEEKYIR